MTQTEAIDILEGAIKKPNTKDGYLGQALSMAINSLSAIEDIKADIRTLYSQYGDGSGWCESRNITLNEVMKIIDKHTSGKE